ncbi:MAG TPA: hypothetical protein VI299_07565 [Polyangiales bacterium]
MKRWLVTISPAHDAADVARAIAGTGVAVEQVLAEIGSVVVNAEQAQIGSVKAVVGVDAVEPDQSVDIGPPDGKIS